MKKKLFSKIQSYREERFDLDPWISMNENVVRVRLEYPMTAFRRSTGRTAGGGGFIDREEPFEPMWPDEGLKSDAERNREREREE